MASIQVYRGKDVGRTYPLGDDATLGSAPDVSIPIADSRLSPRHARILRRSGEFLIADLTGKAAVAVNGRVITGEKKLVNGDKIRLGLTWLNFNADPPPKQQVAGHAAPAAQTAQEDRAAAILGILDAYEIIEELARGAVGEVYHAREKELSREVAIHILPPGLIGENPGIDKKFKEEIVPIAQLGNENIATLLDFGVRGPYIYYTTEWVQGTTLSALVKRDKKLSVVKSLLIARDVARGLAHAHRKRVVHGDIDPDNVVVSGERIVITDFGPSKVIAEITSDGMTSIGLAGNFEFAAPEQCKGDPATPATDIYSLGVLMYFMLAGRVPFTAENPYALIQAHVERAPDPLGKSRKDVPAQVERVMLRMLAKDPARRFGTMEEVISEMEGCVRDLELLKVATTQADADAEWLLERLQWMKSANEAIQAWLRGFECVQVGEMSGDKRYRWIRLLNQAWVRWAIPLSLAIILIGLVAGVGFGLEWLVNKFHESKPPG